MEEQKNKEQILMQFLDAEIERDWTSLKALLDENCTYSVLDDNESVIGKTAVVEKFKQDYAVLDEWHHELLNMYQNEDSVAVEFRTYGYITGEIEGIQIQHNYIEIPVLCIYRFNEGKIIEIREYTSSKLFKRQLEN